MARPNVAKGQRQLMLFQHCKPLVLINRIMSRLLFWSVRGCVHACVCARNDQARSRVVVCEVGIQMILSLAYYIDQQENPTKPTMIRLLDKDKVCLRV